MVDAGGSVSGMERELETFTGSLQIARCKKKGANDLIITLLPMGCKFIDRFDDLTRSNAS